MMNQRTQKEIFLESSSSTSYFQKVPAGKVEQKSDQAMIGQEEYSKKYSNYPISNILHPLKNDVLLGRGGGTNNHAGNIRFRQLVNGHKLRYLAATKVEKPMVAREVVKIWRQLTPHGRFLTQEKLKEKVTEEDPQALIPWKDVGDKKAREKASQCLRERTTDVKHFVKKLELFHMLEDKESKEMVDNETSSLNKRENELTAAQVGQELLRLQQAGVATAHLALNAQVPIVQADSSPSSYSVPTSTTLEECITLENVPSNEAVDPVRKIDPNVSIEQLQAEIAELQKQAEQLTQHELAKVKRERTTVGGATPVRPDLAASTPSFEPTLNDDDTTPKYHRSVCNSVPLAAELFSEMDSMETECNDKDLDYLSMEEYQKTVGELLGVASKIDSNKNLDNSGHEVIDNDGINFSQHTFDQSVLDNMSFMKSSNSIDAMTIDSKSMSLASDYILSSGENTLNTQTTDIAQILLDNPGALASIADYQVKARNSVQPKARPSLTTKRNSRKAGNISTMSDLTTDMSSKSFRTKMSNNSSKQISMLSGLSGLSGALASMDISVAKLDN